MANFYGSKYLVVMKDPKGRNYIARVKAPNAETAKIVAAEKWPRHAVCTIKKFIIA